MEVYDSTDNCVFLGCNSTDTQATYIIDVRHNLACGGGG